MVCTDLKYLVCGDRFVDCQIVGIISEKVRRPWSACGQTP